MKHTADVTIVGAGPVGSLLAVVLADFGLQVVVVERDLAPYALPRAAVMDDEIQQVFHAHGLGERLRAITTPMKGADFATPTGERILGIDLSESGPLGLPLVVSHFQPELDAMVQQEAEARGALLLRGRTASSLEQRDGVRIVLDDASTVESRWLVGCDGASSWTRRTVGLTLEDLGFDQQWLVVDTELLPGSTAVLPDVTRQVCDPARPTTFVPGHARYRRWEFQMQPDDDVEQCASESGIWRLLDGWITPHDARLVRSAVYRFHAVVAPQWRAGNVFLAGDSCHQMPPFLGQGLNSGSRDAVNLAWKLALVHRGLAHDRVLDTFTSERVPHVRSTVEHAVDTGRLIDQLAGRESHGVDRSAGYGGTRPQPILGPGVLVPGHPWVGHPLKFCPEIVTALDANTPTFAIVSRDAVRVPDSFAGLRVVQVRAEPAVTDGHHAVIVRPDRYVAAVVTDPNDLEQAARTLTGALRPTS